MFISIIEHVCVCVFVYVLVSVSTSILGCFLHNAQKIVYLIDGFLFLLPNCLFYLCTQYFCFSFS